MQHDDTGIEREITAGRPADPVEDRPGVGVPIPEDCADGDRAGSVSTEPLDDEKEYERLNPGSGGNGLVVPGSGKDHHNA